MSGLFGVVNPKPNVAVQPYLAAAAGRMSHQPWQRTETWAAGAGDFSAASFAEGLPSIGIGRLGIGIFNREPQPATALEGKLRLWLCGELYQVQRLKDSLAANSPVAAELAAAASSHADLALAAYLAHGLDFASHLVGAFFIAVLDAARQVFVLANDRFGLYPHYYTLAGGQLVFAPEVKGLFDAPGGMQRELNWTAVSEYLRFQQILGEKTFHEGISLFPYGSVASYHLRSGEWRLTRYWDWDCLSTRPTITFNEAVEEAGSLLQQSVQRLAGAEPGLAAAPNPGRALRPGVFLSGGLDSRAILGLAPRGSERIVSATFGAPDSRDVIYAAQIARAAGSRHHWFDLPPNGEWVLANLGLHLKLTEGFHSWVHMHGISTLPALREEMDYNLTGWDGGTVMGHSDHINAIYNFPVDHWTVALQTYQQFTRAYTWPGLTDAEERLLLTSDLARPLVGRAFESMLAEFGRFWHYRQEYAAEYFYVVNHCWRSTQNMVTVARSALEVRFPFWDYDLIDFIYSLPPHIRREQLMFRTIITQRMPRLANIPYDKQEYLPTVSPLPHKLQKYSVRVLKWFKLFPQRPQLYADYENYLRHGLRSWAEGILFAERTRERGIYDMPFVRSLMDRHLAGHEAWILGKIAPLITLEMVLREFFD